MLTLVLLWLVLAVGTYCLGAPLLQLIPGDALLDRIGDRVVFAIILGTIVLAVALSLVAARFPVSPLAGGLVVAVGVAAAAVQRGPRIVGLRALGALVRPRWLAVAVVIATSSALVACDPVGWYDSGLYHYPLIKWLREFGMVPGVGLVHDAFGQSSLWYSLTAFLSAGTLTDRVGAVWGGFAFALALGYVAVVTARIAESRARDVDWFVAVALVTLVPLMLQVVNSPSQDMPLLLFPTIVCAAVLIVEGGPSQVNATLRSVWDIRALPLTLAAGTAAMKLNGIPLVAVTFLLYTSRPWRLSRAFAGAAIVGLVLLPGVIMSVLATGCPLFPSGIGCFATPWTFDRPYVEYASRVFHEFTLRGATKTAPPGMELEHWRREWIEKNWLGITGIALYVICAVWLLRRKRIVALRAGWIILACAGLGIAYVLVLAPATRYMLGYLSIGPALLIAWFSLHSPASSEGRPRGSLRLRRAIALGLTVFLSALALTRSRQFNPRSALVSGNPLQAFRVDSIPFLRPPLFPTPTLYKRQWNDIEYLSPVDTTRVPGNQLRNYTGMFDPDVVSVRCGAAPPPCTPYWAYDDVVLRDPARGIGGGFARRNPRVPGHAFIGLRAHRLSDGQLTSQR